MRKLRALLAATLLFLVAGAVVGATTAAACPGTEKAGSEGGE